jgi:rubrerythrin
MKINKYLNIISLAFLLTSVLNRFALGQETNTAKFEPPTNNPQHSIAVGTTLDNLQTAYYAESNETVLYSKFAKKADDEGYHQVASMFRAVARAEEIHANKKAGLIKQLGGMLKTDSLGEQALVGTTRENLDFALLSEAYERDVMYPEFIAQAQKENNADVVRSFKLCMAAEPRHHAMFKQILKDLEGYRGASTTFLVCPECGNAVRTMTKSVCEICATPKEKFEKVK